MSKPASDGSVYQVLDLLHSDKLKKRLQDIYAEIMEEAKDSLGETGEWGYEDADYILSHTGNSEPVLYAYERYRPEIKDIFTSCLLQKLSPPYIITAEELTDAFVRETRSPPNMFDQSLELFLGNISKFLICHHTSRPFAIGELDSGRRLRSTLNFTTGGNARVSGHEHDHDNVNNAKQWSAQTGTIWTKNGVSLEFAGTGMAEVDTQYRTDMYAGSLAYVRIEGLLSPCACENLKAKMSILLPSIVRTLQMLSPNVICEGPHTLLPAIESDIWEQQADLLTRCLDSYYSSSPKKQSFERRIHNAIQLLAEADGQMNDAVGLALEVAAIEALLGKKGPEISTTLAAYVARLLEPEPKQRVSAQKFFKNLYDIRCDVLHGTKLDGEGKSRINGRFLAAAVLAAIVDRRGFVHRSGYDPETPEDLFAELKKMQYDKGLLTGDTKESPACKLWREQATV